MISAEENDFDEEAPESPDSPLFKRQATQEVVFNNLTHKFVIG